MWRFRSVPLTDFQLPAILAFEDAAERRKS
jgi:hypothetical protein